jgi:hypothetical protein
MAGRSVSALSLALRTVVLTPTCSLATSATLARARGNEGRRCALKKVLFSARAHRPCCNVESDPPPHSRSLATCTWLASTVQPALITFSMSIQSTTRAAAALAGKGRRASSWHCNGALRTSWSRWFRRPTRRVQGALGHGAVRSCMTPTPSSTTCSSPK